MFSRVARLAQPAIRQMSTSAALRATSSLTMPALSPTMTEGTVTEWKVKVGDSFVAGDILCQIETDKASIDVEAQDDGVMGKIIVQDGTANVQVGELIALLAEEGDDLSAIKEPEQAKPAAQPASASQGKEADNKSDKSFPESSTSQPPAPSKKADEKAVQGGKKGEHGHLHPTHTKTLLPSVLRLLQLEGIEDTSSIKATGPRGHLTKGDVLAHLGKIKSATGSEKVEHDHAPPKKAAGDATAKPAAPKKEMDALSLRQLIAAGLAQPLTSSAPKATKPSITFDSVLDAYLPAGQRSSARLASQRASETVASSGPKAVTFDSILGL